MSCHLSKDVKQVILRVLEFCKEEKYNRRPIIPLVKVNLRVATATGVSLHTVTNIIREGKIAAANGTRIGTIKQRKPRNDKVMLSQFDLDLIRDIVNDYFKEHKEWPSLRKLLPLVRKQIGFTNSIETLRKLLKQMGFSYEKTENNKWVIQNHTSHDIVPANFLAEDFNKEINHDHDYIKC